MKKFLQVIAYEDGEVIESWDVTGKSERQIDKIDRGLNINLAHELYYSKVVTSEEG